MADDSFCQETCRTVFLKKQKKSSRFDEKSEIESRNPVPHVYAARVTPRLV
jgi:hypothetical protein